MNEQIDRPEAPSGAGLVLTHGASGSSRSPFLIALASAFSARGVTVLRYDLPYRQASATAPPPPEGGGETREQANGTSRFPDRGYLATFQVSTFQVEPCWVGLKMVPVTFLLLMRNPGRTYIGIDGTSLTMTCSALFRRPARVFASGVNCAFEKSADAFLLQ